MSHEDILGGVVLGTGTRKYKGPAVGACVFEDQRERSVAGVMSTVAGGENR